jgi:hypothetical protein
MGEGLSDELLHHAEQALWSGRDRHLVGDALRRHIHRAYPGRLPVDGGDAEEYSAWREHARRLAWVPSDRERLASWAARRVAHGGWRALADRLDVDVSRLRWWVYRGEDCKDDELTGRVVRLMEVCDGLDDPGGCARADACDGRCDPDGGCGDTGGCGQDDASRQDRCVGM